MGNSLEDWGRYAKGVVVVVVCVSVCGLLDVRPLGESTRINFALVP
jgi:hypothetical protein